MRFALSFLGVTLVVLGFFWVTNVLPSTFIGAQRKWDVNGWLVIAVGVVVLLAAKWGRRPSR